MTKSTSSKIVAAAVGFALALTVFVGVGSVQAQSVSSTASLIDTLVALGLISPDKAAAAKAALATSASASSYTFSADLTVGSKGDAVTALQNALGVTPATGYFGAVTKAAVQKYQTANGINPTGYVGPLTRASLNKSSTTTTTTTTTGTPVVNSGVEGTLTADKASISNSTVYEGDTMHSVLGIKLQARLSDINVQRVRLNLGADTTVYTRAFKTMYLTDDSGRVLAQADLNSNTVVKDGSNYILTFGGFNYTVPRDVTKYVWVKADAYSSFKTTGSGNCASTAATCTISLSSDGVRGTDGLGLDQYGGSDGFSQSVTLQGSLIDTATLDLSVDAANIKTGDVVASDGANNDQADQVPLLVFDLRANKDNLKVTDITATISSTPNLATTTTAYLYDGSTLVQTESVSGSSVTFSDIDNLWVSKDTTKALTLKVDVRSAVATPDTMSATVTTVRSENSLGTTVNTSSTAVGENQIVRNAGPVFSLVSKSIAVSGANNSGSTQSTSTVTATFALSVTAKGSDVYFANQASSTNKMFAFKLYNSAGTDLTGTSGLATSSEGFTIPSSGVTTVGTNAFKIAKGAAPVVISPITVDIVGKYTTTGLPISGVAVAIDKIFWSLDGSATTSSNFMSGKTEWRTDVKNP